MPMDPGEFEKFQAHLMKIGRWNNACPICGTRNWQAHGPLSMRTLQWERMEATGYLNTEDPGVFASVLLICGRCHFFHQFAWRPIEMGIIGG
ncbi:MAG TPA: hypothetical protein VKZ18_28820 [Polyangia bacterium]|nr:hypothetical protein [Polyangia bacterium]